MKLATLILTLLMLALVTPGFAAEDPTFVAPFSESIGTPTPGADTKIYGHLYFPIEGEGTFMLNSGTSRVCWPSLNAYTFRATAGTIEVSSSDVDDQLSGGDTGAWTVEVVGLDANYNLIKETLTCFAQAAAVAGNEITGNHSTKSFLRVLSARVLTSGTSAGNEGTIYIHSDHDGVSSGVPGSTTETYAIIPIAKGVSNMTQFTVPDGYQAIVDSIGLSTPNATTCAVELLSNEYGKGWMKLGKLNCIAYGNVEMKGPWVISEKSDVKLVGSTGVDTGIVENGRMRVRFVKQ